MDEYTHAAPTPNKLGFGQEKDDATWLIKNMVLVLSQVPRCRIKHRGRR